MNGAGPNRAIHRSCRSTRSGTIFWYYKEDSLSEVIEDKHVAESAFENHGFDVTSPAVTRQEMFL